MYMVASNRRDFLHRCAVIGAGISTGFVSSELLTGRAFAMRTIVGGNIGRIVILSFERGELFLEGIRDKAKELGIKNAVLLSVIGTFEKAVFHRVKNLNTIAESEIITVNAPIELSSVSGVIANGVPHFHMVFSDLDKTYSGHLEEGCVVLYLAEAVLAELKGVELIRRPLLQEKEE